MSEQNKWNVMKNNVLMRQLSIWFDHHVICVQPYEFMFRACATELFDKKTSLTYEILQEYMRLATRARQGFRNK